MKLSLIWLNFLLFFLTECGSYEVNRRRSSKAYIPDPSIWFHITSTLDPNQVLDVKGQKGCLGEKIIFDKKKKNISTQLWRKYGNMYLNKSNGMALHIKDGNMILYYARNTANQKWSTGGVVGSSDRYIYSHMKGNPMLKTTGMKSPAGLVTSEKVPENARFKIEYKPKSW